MTADVLKTHARRSRVGPGASPTCAGTCDVKQLVAEREEVARDGDFSPARHSGRVRYKSERRRRPCGYSRSHAFDLRGSSDVARQDEQTLGALLLRHHLADAAGIEAHFRAVADATALPVILHDIPSRTIREIADDTLVRLAESGRFAGLRDSSGDVARILRVRPRLGTGFRLLSGDDTTALAFLACGGDGCISQVANVAPDLCRDIFANCRQGRLQSARYLQKRILRLAAELSNESPATLKYALSLLGLMRPHTRLPVTELDGPARHRMTSVMADMAEEDPADIVPV